MFSSEIYAVVKKNLSEGVREKSYKFALKVVNMVRSIQREQKEYVLSGQLMRSGTSIGANIEEANAGISKKDFTAKMAIASKEARETMYWLNLLRDSGFIDKEEAKVMINDCEELIRMLTSIVKTSQENMCC